MKRNGSVLAFAVFLALAVTVVLSVARAQRRDETEGIKRLIAQFVAATAANDLDRIAALFTKAGTYRSGESTPQPVADAIRQLPPKRLPWDERTSLAIEVQNIRLTGPDTAEARAIQSDYAPMLGTTRKWSCAFVFAQVGKNWKIVSYAESRLSAPPGELREAL